MTKDIISNSLPSLQDVEHDRFMIAVRQAAETMSKPEYGDKLQKAMDLVLSGSVILHQDATATVKSGSHTYQLAPECACQDSQHRSRYCKHFLAVELLKRTYFRLNHSPNGHQPTPLIPQPQGEAEPQEQPQPVPQIPQSNLWSVTEAPASCCLKFTLNGVEILYTMRDVNDNLLYGRIKRILPIIQEKMSTANNGEQTQANQDLCPIHHAPMKRYTKGNQSWLSHQMADGSWCQGK
jgi:hypothetical protein